MRKRVLKDKDLERGVEEMDKGVCFTIFTIVLCFA